jgi:hypothetical protein
MPSPSVESGSPEREGQAAVIGCLNCPEGRSAAKDYHDAIWLDIDNKLSQKVRDYLAERLAVAVGCKLAETNECALSAAGMRTPNPPTT